MIHIGVDPGTGITSPTAIAAVDVSNKRILLVQEIRPIHSNYLRSISMQVETVVEFLRREHCDAEFTIAVETFVMYGKPGQMLQRLIGAILSRVTEACVYKEVYNTTIKKVVAGHGRADKLDVGNGVALFFRGRPDEPQVLDYIKNKEWDKLDAIAIAITGALHDDQAFKRKDTEKNAARGRSAKQKS